MQSLIEVEGNRFSVRIERDDLGAPWEEHDGHGIVSDWTTRAKRPGELVLCRDRGSARYYDFQETVKIARRDGWNAAPYDVEGETPRQRAAKAAMVDYDRLRRWCSDDWYWCGVIVELLDDSGDQTGETESLWGIESDCEEYIEETATQLAGELIARLEAPMRRRACCTIRQSTGDDHV